MDTESRYLRDIRDAIKGIAKRSGMDVSGNTKSKYLKEIADAIRENGGGGKDGNDKVKQEMIDTGSDDPIVFSESLSTNTGFVGKSSHFTYSPGSKTVKLTDGPAIPNKEAKITPESETFLNKIKTDVDESTYDETRYSAKVSTASNGYGIQFIKSESTTSNPAGGPGPVTVEKTRAYTEIRHNAVAVTNIDNDPNTGFNRTMALKDDDIVMGGETPNTWDGVNTSLKSALAAASNILIVTATLNDGVYTTDVSFDDIIAANAAGKAVFLKVGTADGFVPLSQAYSSNLIFGNQNVMNYFGNTETSISFTKTAYTMSSSSQNTLTVSTTGYQISGVTVTPLS